MKRYIPILAAAAGVAGALLRGLNLHTGYEAETCLPVPGNSPQIALIALSVAAVVVFFILSRSFRAQAGSSFEQTFGCRHTGYKMIAVITGIAMGIAGLGGLYLLATGGAPAPGLTAENPVLTLLPLIPLWLLAILTPVSFFLLASMQASGIITERRAILSIIPMFWACFDLIITFKDNGSSPFVSLYAFELFAAIALVFAFYTLAGFFYAKSNPGRFVFTASLGVFFSWTCVGGYLVCGLLGGTPVRLTMEAVLRYVCFAAASVYLLANLFISTHALDRK